MVPGQSAHCSSALICIGAPLAAREITLRSDRKNETYRPAGGDPKCSQNTHRGSPPPLKNAIRFCYPGDRPPPPGFVLNSFRSIGFATPPLELSHLLLRRDVPPPDETYLNILFVTGVTRKAEPLHSPPPENRILPALYLGYLSDAPQRQETVAGFISHRSWDGCAAH